jgi:hypothetical protein
MFIFGIKPKSIMKLTSLATTIIISILFSRCTQTPSYLDEFVQKAKKNIALCKTLGDGAVSRSRTVIVWDLENNGVHRAADLLDQSMGYSDGDGPVTVFLVTAKNSEQVGTYSISGQPAYREWVDVYVVQFRNHTDKGTAIANHEVLSLDPAERRTVRQTFFFS